MSLVPIYSTSSREKIESNTLTTPRAPLQFLTITAVQGMGVEQRLRVSEVRKSAQITRKRSRK